jgi:integrase
MAGNRWRLLDHIHSKPLSFRLSIKRSKGLANRSVVLYQRIKAQNKWTFCKVAEKLSTLVQDEYYVSWYDGSKKQMAPAGGAPAAALAALNKKRLELAYVAAGGEVKESTLPQNEKRKRLSAAIKEYLEDCADRQGKSGYGLAPRTPKAYKYRLGFLTEFKPEAYLDEIDAEFIKAFRRFLRNHPSDLGDRTCFNILQSVSTFLLKNNNSAANPFLREMSYPPTVVVPYSNEELEKFFAACNDEEEQIFKFFLHSMGREMEVANCEIRDLQFDKNVLHISPKPDRNFRLKGKRSGQAKNGRKVPLPALFMARLQAFCAGMAPRALVFPNGIGGVEGHFLRKCKNIAKRAGLSSWNEFDLHRWRKTGATRHHEAGVSVRKIQAWLGHESLEVTLAYLGVEDAADETSQEQVNSGALANFV